MLRMLFLIIALIVATAARAGPLHDAAGEGDVLRVRQLLAEGEEINQNDPLTGTPLQVAAMRGQAEVVKLLLAEDADVNQAGGMVSLSPLQLAVSSSREVVALLLAGGADINVTDIGGNTPLHLAADAGDIEIVTLLLDDGAAISAPNADGLEPIEFAGAAGHFDIVDLFIARGALPSEPITPVSGLLAEADPERGRELFRSTGCSHCHDFVEGGHNVGPNLWAIVGSDKASSGTFDFSEALRRIGGKWTYEELNAWIASPKRFAPGNRMSMAPLQTEGVTGLADAADRADLIAFLRLQHDNPPPLPE